MTQIAEAVAYRAWTQSDLHELIEHEARTALPGLVRLHAPGLVAVLARDAVAQVRGQLQHSLEKELRAKTSGAVEREAVRLLPGIASEAVSEATPDWGEIARRLVDDVEAGIADTVERRAHATIPALVQEVTGQAVKSVDEAIRQARERAARSITDAVDKQVGKALAEFTPTTVNVTLPSGEKVELGTDSHAVLPDLLMALHARCHVLLVGPAGTGKSTLAKHAAVALGLDFQALSLGPTTPMSKVFGYFDAHGHYHDTPFRRAFEHGGVMLLDELDNGHPGMLAELNQAMALGTCAFADGMVEAHENFRLVATGNTFGTGADRQYVGRQTLDSATLDRFVVIDVPIDEKLEERIAVRHAPKARKAVRELLVKIRALRELVAEKQLPIILSPRASIDGAKLLQAGAPLEQVIQWRIVRGLSAAHRRALGLD